MNAATQSSVNNAAEMSRLCADTASGKPLPSLPERLLTMKEVCARLQISAVTGWRLYAERGLRVVRIGKSIRVRKSDLDAWLDKNASGGSEGKVQ